MSVEFFLFFLKLYAADVADCDCRTNDADNTKRVGTGIAVSDGWYISIGENSCKCLICSTKTRSVGDSTIHRTYHHWEIDRI